MRHKQSLFENVSLHHEVPFFSFNPRSQTRVLPRARDIVKHGPLAVLEIPKTVPDDADGDLILVALQTSPRLLDTRRQRNTDIRVDISSTGMELRAHGRREDLAQANVLAGWVGSQLCA